MARKDVYQIFQEALGVGVDEYRWKDDYKKNASDDKAEKLTEDDIANEQAQTVLKQEIEQCLRNAFSKEIDEIAQSLMAHFGRYNLPFDMLPQYITDEVFVKLREERIEAEKNLSPKTRKGLKYKMILKFGKILSEVKQNLFFKKAKAVNSKECINSNKGINSKKEYLSKEPQKDNNKETDYFARDDIEWSDERAVSYSKNKSDAENADKYIDDDVPF